MRSRNTSAPRWVKRLKKKDIGYETYIRDFLHRLSILESGEPWKRWLKAGYKATVIEELEPSEKVEVYTTLRDAIIGSSHLEVVAGGDLVFLRG